MTGIALLKTALTTISSLKDQRSSRLPPPLATINRSGFLTIVSSVSSLNLSIALAICEADPSP